MHLGTLWNESCNEFYSANNHPVSHLKKCVNSDLHTPPAALGSAQVECIELASVPMGLQRAPRAQPPNLFHVPQPRPSCLRWRLHSLSWVILPPVWKGDRQTLTLDYSFCQGLVGRILICSWRWANFLLFKSCHMIAQLGWYSASEGRPDPH